MGTWTGTQPDFNSWIQSAWGWPNQVSGGACFPYSGFSNIVIGTNPPYTANDFLSYYPKFGGTPQLILLCTTTAGSAQIYTPAPVPYIAPGQLVIGPGIPPGAVVLTVPSNSNWFFINTPATATTPSGSPVTLSVNNQPLVPLVVLNAFIAAASASTVQARWLDWWQIGLNWYVAHFCTLWCRTEIPGSGNGFATPGQAVMAGIQNGITVAKSAGPSSQGLQPIAGLEDWSDWTSTTYGVSYATRAKIVGMGVSLCY
jgi:hypothetical protein